MDTIQVLFLQILDTSRKDYKKIATKKQIFSIYS